MRFSRSEGVEYKRRSKKTKPVAAHPLFVPILALWGALVAAATMLVLPEILIEQIVEASALGALGGSARLFFAAIAALLGAAAMYFVGAHLRSALGGDAAEMFSRARERVRPIDPASELGSDSLDAPIVDEPFADHQPDQNSDSDSEAESDEVAAIDDWDHDDFDDSAWVEAEHEAGPEAGPEAADAAEVEPKPRPELETEADPLGDDFAEQAFQSRAARTVERARGSKPIGEKPELLKAMKSHRAAKATQTRSFKDSSAKPEAEDDLDLAAFDTVDEAPAAAQAAAAVQTPPKTAIEKLRRVPPSELSLVEMVERLAVALRNHQEAGRSKSNSQASRERDAALAETLNALSNFTEAGYQGKDAKAAEPAQTDETDAGETDSEGQLRNAFAKLQGLRGAA